MARADPASESEADLSANTTWHLVADIDRLRMHRGIERWQVFGGSWGSALALAYAEEHGDRVAELVLRESSHSDGASWISTATVPPGSCSPSATRCSLIPLGGRSFAGDTISAYHDLLFDPDPGVHGPAGVAWSTWEAATITLEPDEGLIADFSDPTYALAFARIENHYFYHRGWFAKCS